MNMNAVRRFSALVAACPVLAIADPGIQTHSTLKFTYELIDLAPDDGVTPTVTFNFDSGSTSAQAGGGGVYEWRMWYPLPNGLTVPGGLAPISAASPFGSSASLTGSLQGGDMIVDLQTRGPLAAISTLSSAADPYRGVVITGKAKLVLSADFDQSFTWERFPGMPPAYYAKTRRTTYLGFTCPRVSNLFCGERSDWVKYFEGADNLSISFSHWGEGSRETGLKFATSLYAFFIPEPSTYAMMLAGLGVVAVSARKSKRK